MNIATLILETFRRRLEADPERQGFRLSPVAITPADARAIAAAADSLGPDVYLVVSAPGVPVLERARFFMAPDERAAEQATSWRNTVRPSDGGHLLYVSAEEHDKASGLAGLLSEVTEDDLAETFAALCDEPDSRMPAGVADALRDSGILGRVPADALCHFGTAVVADLESKGESPADAWTKVGRHLPILSLAQDTALRRQNAGERLVANQKIVARAQVIERRQRGGSGATSAIEKHLRDGLSARTAEKRREALHSIDLGTVQTTQLRPPKASKKKPRIARQTPDPAAAETSEPSKKREVELFPGLSLPSVDALPAGLASMLDELNRASGASVAWKVRSEARSCLSRLPGGIQPIPSPFEVPEVLKSQFKVWSEARVSLEQILRDQLGDHWAALLVRTPLDVLAHKVLVDPARALVDASSALYREATKAKLGTPELAKVLALDTLTVSDGSGPSVCVLGPFHPLWLYQALLAAETFAESSEEGKFGRALLERSLEAPAAPQTWPLSDGTQLTLGRAEAHLLVYQRTPDFVGAEALRSTGKALLLRYLELCPHANLSSRVAIVDGDSTNLVNGMADLLEGNDRLPELQRLTVATQQVPSLSQVAVDAAASGRLQLTGLPTDADVLFASQPHIVIRFAPPPATLEDSVPGAPTATSDIGGGLLRTDFFMDAHGLQSRTKLTGHMPLESVEALHAAARHRTARGEFMTESRATSLASVLPTKGSPAATWHVALGARLGGQPPPDHRLLVHEAIDIAASCAVATREVRPAARAVAEGLRLLNIDESRPQMLTKIANRLAAASSSGLLALTRDGTQLIAGGVLALELRRRIGDHRHAVIAQLDGAHYAAIVGEPGYRDRGGAVILGASVDGTQLSLTVGYASLDSSADLRIERRHVAGRVGRKIEAVVRACKLSAAKTPMGAAAREALSWFLWPAMAAQGLQDRVLGDALRRWADGTPAAITVVALVPPKVLPRRDATATASGVPVTFVGFDTDLVNRLVLQDPR